MNTIQAAMLYITCGLTVANFIILVRVWYRVSGSIEGEITVADVKRS